MTAADQVRRALGLVFLGVAGVLTLLGLTWLAPVLKGINYLLYWLTPIFAALGALGCAFIDLHVLRRRYRDERAAIAREVFQRRDPPPDNSKPGG